jgi:hypothetical protein
MITYASPFRKSGGNDVGTQNRGIMSGENELRLREEVQTGVVIVQMTSLENSEELL